MPAGAWQFTNGARTNILDGTFDFDSDTFKCALLLSSSNISTSSTTWAAVTGEHANQGAPGYETGGKSITFSLSGTTTVKVDISTDPTWTATGGNITARYACIYEVAGNVVCFCELDDTPADVTATTGNDFTVAAHANGVFDLS